MESTEQEKIVIGALLLKPEAIEEVAGFLQPSDFGAPICRWCYDKILGYWEGGEVFTPEILLSQVPEEKYSQYVDFIQTIIEYTPTAQNVEYFGRKVKEHAIKRHLAEHLDNADAIDYDYVQKIIEGELSEIKKLPGRDIYSSRLGRLIQQTNQNLKSGKARGIDPGFDFLRNTIKAIIPTHLWIVGGYTSIGKSAFAIELIMRLLENGNPGIAIFSTEMAAETYVLRMISNQTGIPVLDLSLSDGLREEVLDTTCRTLEGANLWIFDDVYTFDGIARISRQIKKNMVLSIVVIDFIQNLYGVGTIYERMSVLSPRMQALAKELGLTVIALSQISHEAVRDKSEIIGFKGAGEIAAAADLGIWLERDKEYKEFVNAIVRKNRHGPIGQRRLRYVANWTRFEEME